MKHAVGAGLITGKTGDLLDREASLPAPSWRLSCSGWPRRSPAEIIRFFHVGGHTYKVWPPTLLLLKPESAFFAELALLYICCKMRYNAGKALGA